MAQRIHSILVLDEGKTAKEVAKILGVSEKTVKGWAKAFAKYPKYGIKRFWRFGYERMVVFASSTKNSLRS